MVTPKRVDLSLLASSHPQAVDVGALATKIPTTRLACPLQQPTERSPLCKTGVGSSRSSTCVARPGAAPGSFETAKRAYPYASATHAKAQGQHPCQQGKPCQCGGTCKTGATPKAVSRVIRYAGATGGRGCGCGGSRGNAGWPSRGVEGAPPPLTRDSIEQFRSRVAGNRDGSKPNACSGWASSKPSRATSLVAANVRLARDGRAAALPTQALKNIVHPSLSSPDARIRAVNLLIPGETRDGLHCPAFREFSSRFVECMEAARQAANRALPPVNPWSPHLHPLTMREWDDRIYERDTTRYPNLEDWCEDVRDLVRSRILGWSRARYELRDGVARPTVLSPTRETWSVYRDEALEGRHGPWTQVFMRALASSGCEDLTSDPDFLAFWHFAHTLMNDEGLQYVFPVPSDWLAPGTDSYFLIPPGLQECLDRSGPVPLFPSPIAGVEGIPVPGIYPMPRGVWVEGCPQVVPGPIVDRWRSDLRPFPSPLPGPRTCPPEWEVCRGLNCEPCCDFQAPSNPSRCKQLCCYGYR